MNIVDFFNYLQMRKGTYLPPPEVGRTSRRTVHFFLCVRKKVFSMKEFDFNQNTVIFLCGLIGSGKTPFALKHCLYFTDLDLIPGFSTKSYQLQQTRILLNQHGNVCHITTYPTKQELEELAEYNQRFLLLDTSQSQRKTNILIRNRKRDIDNLPNVLLANQNLQEKYLNSNTPFESVKVF